MLASRDAPCGGVEEEEEEDGVGDWAERTKMPGGWLKNTGFDE